MACRQRPRVPGNGYRLRAYHVLPFRLPDHNMPRDWQGPAFAGCNTNLNKICWFNMFNNFSAISDNIKFISFHRYARQQLNSI